MQTVMSASTSMTLRQPTAMLQSTSSRTAISQPLRVMPQRSSARRASVAPKAFVRGYCGMPFGAGRVQQQVLQQMLQELQNCGPAASAKDFELPLAVDAVEEDDAYVFRADIPGVKREDLKIQTKDRQLTISGKRERDSQVSENSKQRFERMFGKFSRQLRLPEDADSNSIKAKVDNGVLTVRVAKLTKLPGVEEVQVDF